MLEKSHARVEGTRNCLPDDRRLIAEDRLVPRISGHQPNVAISPLEGLHRGLPVNHRGDDLTVLGDGLLTDDQPVSIEDGSGGAGGYDGSSAVAVRGILGDDRPQVASTEISIRSVASVRAVSMDRSA